MILISQERLLEKLDHCSADQFFNIASIRNFIREEPEAVVRCKDCKYKCETEDGEWNPEDVVCSYWDTDGLEENDYCSYAERKEDG